MVAAAAAGDTHVVKDSPKNEVIGFGFPRIHVRQLREKAEDENRTVSSLVRLLVLRYLGLAADKAKEEKADAGLK